MALDDLVGLVRPGIRTISAYHPVVRSGGVVLDANEHPHGIPVEVRRGLAAELAAADLHRYPDATELHEFLARDHGLERDAVVLGNGSDELISLLCATFAHPRDGASVGKVLFPVPSFSVYTIAAKSAGVDVCAVPLSSDFTLDMGAMNSRIEAEEPNVVFLARPNNPTGTFWPEEQLLEMLKKFPGVLFVSDEAYGAYGAPSSLEKLSQFPNLLILRTLSKIGLAALRVGYLCGDPFLCREVNKVRGPYNIGSLNVRAAMYMLKNHRDWTGERCSQVVQAREKLAAELQALDGVEVFPSAANFLLVRLAGGDERTSLVYQRLVDDKIWVRRFTNDRVLADCLRITVGTPEENSAFFSAFQKNL